jgi:hypothetical protein
MGNLCKSISKNVHRYKTQIYPRLSYKMSKFCSEICFIDDDKHKSPPTSSRTVKFNDDVKINIRSISPINSCIDDDIYSSVYIPTHTYSMPKEKIKVVELTLQQKLANLKELDPVETLVVIETPVDEPVVIETPVDVPVVIETPVDVPVVIETSVNRINADDEWDHISSDEDYSHVDEYWHKHNIKI